MSRRRGRPSQEEGAAVTREELVRLAAELIGRDGLNGTSMRGVAREAGVSLATLQHHFRTKDLLWKAVIDEVVVPAEVRPPQATPDAQSFFTKVVRERLGDAVRHPGLTGRVLADGSPQGVALLEYLMDATQEIRAQDRQRITMAVAVGRLRPIDVDALIVLLGVALPVLSSSKQAIRLLVGPNLEDDEQRAQLSDAISDILLFGLLPRTED